MALACWLNSLWIQVLIFAMVWVQSIVIVTLTICSLLVFSVSHSNQLVGYSFHRLLPNLGFKQVFHSAAKPTASTQCRFLQPFIVLSCCFSILLLMSFTLSWKVLFEFCLIEVEWLAKQDEALHFVVVSQFYLHALFCGFWHSALKRRYVFCWSVHFLFQISLLWRP